MSIHRALLFAARRALARVGLDRRLREEATFWRRELTLSGSYAEFVAASLDPALMDRVYPVGIDPYVADLTLRFAAPPRTLDIGCGPVSLLALGRLRAAFTLTGIDPLADRYRKFLAAIGHPADWPLVAGYGEDIGRLFPPNSFDLIFCCNALDHTQSPDRVLAAACAVLRPGGTLYLQGYVREGSANQFRGLHQHDLYWDAQQGLMWGRRAWPLRRARQARSLTAGLPLEILAHSEASDLAGASLLAVYRRTEAAVAATS